MSEILELARRVLAGELPREASRDSAAAFADCQALARYVVERETTVAAKPTLVDVIIPQEMALTILENEILRLQAENATLRGNRAKEDSQWRNIGSALTDCGNCEEKLEQEVSALKAELAEAQKDTERLDWCFGDPDKGAMARLKIDEARNYDRLIHGKDTR